CAAVCAGEPIGVFLSAEEQEQQSVEPNKLVPEPGRQRGHCVCHHGAGAPDAVSPIRAGHARFSVAGELPGSHGKIDSLLCVARFHSGRRRSAGQRAPRAIDTKTGGLAGISRLFLAARLRLHDWRAPGFLYSQIPVRRPGRSSLASLLSAQGLPRRKQKVRTKCCYLPRRFRRCVARPTTARITEIASSVTSESAVANRY